MWAQGLPLSEIGEALGLTRSKIVVVIAGPGARRFDPRSSRKQGRGGRAGKGDDLRRTDAIAA
jgi:hypothetical protein